MIINNSGLSNPANSLFIPKPIIELYPDKTAREVAYIYGAYDSMFSIQVYENEVWAPLKKDFYLLNNKFVYPAILKTGVNTITFRLSDGNNFSQPINISIEKILKQSVRYRSRRLLINGIDVSENNILNAVDVNEDLETGITQINFEVKNLDFEKYDTVEYILDDGLKESHFKGTIKSGKTVYDGEGTKISSFMVQSKSDALPRLTMTTSFTGVFNGDILTRIFNAAGFEKVYVPKGGMYVGPRTIENQKVYESIVKKILFIESWNISTYDEDTIIINPTRCSKYVDWTFNDYQIQTLDEEFDTTLAINKLHLAYEPTEDDLNINYQLGENVPDKSDECWQDSAFFKNDLYDEEIDHIDNDSVIFFGMWGTETTDKDPSGKSYTLDWDNITKARLTIKFNNAGGDATNNTGGSLLTYNVDMDVFPEKKLAVGYYDLRVNHLNPDVAIYYQYVVIDENGHYIGDPLKFHYKRLDGEYSVNTNFSEMVYRFGVQMTEVKKLASFERKWHIKSVEDLPKDTEDNIFISRYDLHGNEVDCTFYVSLDLDDAAVDTLTFDFENATSNYKNGACLLNATLITDENQLINGNKYIYWVKSHKPNKPIKRADKILFKFKSHITLGKTIALKFNIWGRNFIKAADGWEDYASINVVESNQKNIEFRKNKGLEPDIIDGGTILSSFVSSKDQAERKVKRVLYAQEDGYIRKTISTPGFSEMRPGQLVRLFSNRAGETYKSYAYITSCKPTGKYNNIELTTTKPIVLSDTEVEPYAADLNFSMSDIIKKLADVSTEFEIGTVLARKYRGTFSVQLDDGTVYKYVVSRVIGVKSEDRVAVVQTPAGSRLIIEIIRPSLADSDMEDLIAPTDEDYEAWEEAIEEENTEDYEKYPSVVKGRPMGNIIGVSSIEAGRVHNGIIPYKDIYFDFTLSHDCDCWGIEAGFSSSFTSNFANFIYLKVAAGSGYIRCQSHKTGTGRYRVYPTEDLPFNEEIEIGIMPVNSRHPMWSRMYTLTTEYNLRNIQNNAFLRSAWSKKFKVQPELEIKYLFKGTDWVDIETNQALDFTTTMDNDNFFIEIIDAKNG